jgi:hypothetical protein
MNALNLNSKATNKVLDKNHSFFTKFPKTNEKFSHNVNYNDDNPFSGSIKYNLISFNNLYFIKIRNFMVRNEPLIRLF